MNRFSKTLSTLVISLCASLPSMAQFYLTGDDPGRVRWSQISTDHYKIIFPRGMDSLARVYGVNLEVYRGPVGQTISYLPGEYTRGPIPVVFHPYNSVSNGSVAWAPRRMDLYTQMEAYNPDPMSWVRQLTIHEQRHVAQMQFGLSRGLRPFGWFFGEMFNGLTCEIYGGSDFLEGDAVVAETALTQSGRGRKANFLNYYMISFDNDVWRNWHRWRNGSQRWYTPDHYSLGYMTIAGLRYNYNTPDYTGQLYTNAARRVWDLGWNSVTKRITGKNTRTVFDESAHTFYRLWKNDRDAMAPYMPSEQVVKTPRRYTEYNHMVIVGDNVYAVKKSLVRTPGLVRIDSLGKEKRISEAAAYSGDLNAGTDGKIYWSETVTGPRWSLSNRSLLRSYDVSSGKKKDITKKGKHYNPVMDGHVASVSYFEKGGSAVDIIDPGTKTIQTRYHAPDSLQAVQCAWVDGSLIVSCVSDNGTALYRINGNSWEQLTEVEPATLNELRAVPEQALLEDGSAVMFTSDRSGVDELYHYYPASGRRYRISNTRYGATGWQYTVDGKWLYYSAHGIDGNLVCKTATDSLTPALDSLPRHHYIIADALSEQEARYKGNYEKINPEDVEFSDVKPYHKILHLFNIHSWAPVYFNVDNLMNLSFDNIYQSASLGAAAVSQNRLGTAIAHFGYSAHKDPDIEGKWRHSGHATFTYTGWFPAFELGVDFNDRAASTTSFRGYTNNGKTAALSAYSYLRGPQISGHFSVYVPMSFSKGGWYGGFIPKATYSISNDSYDTSMYMFRDMHEQWKYTDDDGNERIIKAEMRSSTPFRLVKGVNRINQSISASVRGYIMQQTASSAIYPYFGIGAEVGFYTKLGLGTFMTKSGETPLFSPQMYAYGYMYLPGFIPQQGWRLSAKYTTSLSDKCVFASTMISTLPRGLSSTPRLLTVVGAQSAHSMCFTADYGIPVWIGDLNLGIAYIKRLIFTPHFDLCVYPQKGRKFDSYLWSAGIDLNLDLATFMWLKLPIKAGIRYDYNGGNTFNNLKKGGIKMSRHFVGPLFTMDF